MTFDEAMAIVDASGRVAREGGWVMCASGFAWGPWVERMRRWTKDDGSRMDARSAKGDWSVPQIEASGEWYRAVCTLCESYGMRDQDWPQEAREATDWANVTDRFDGGCPKGYKEYMGYD